eukprot:CAMPEP_0206144814 /NCGR_PEP_ID=MMETSP1473-20131121/25459_1 /ASSEMBLY_ACC=CAM_ASM_001109 /TAXON_ID=1461547 /ORGANISM="Stichococcus sp, Strain RCC1054" /LENGTH=139 /DNA_ID=CAMNT_0053540787 /DNA_START=608 /DNA_END=1024 /DNA_ORIENTATION=-
MAQWQLHDMPPTVPARSGHCMVFAGRRLYLISGRAGDNYIDTMSILDVDSGAWNAVNLPFPPRQHFSATLVGADIWVVGGSSLTEVYEDVWTFDVRKTIWTCQKIRGPVHLLQRTGHAAVRHPAGSAAAGATVGRLGAA